MTMFVDGSNNFVETHNVDAVSLYCRVSNEAAYRLYSNSLQYSCQEIIPEYYEDKENAYMMKLNDLKSIYDKDRLTREVSEIYIDNDDMGLLLSIKNNHEDVSGSAALQS